MFKHILVPLDGSPRAEQSIPIAAKIAKSSGASMLLLEVVNAANEFRLYPAGASLYMRKLHGRHLTHATDYLSQLAHTLKLEEGIETHIAVFSGQPAPVILEVMQNQDIDLLVLSSHGHTGFQRWALGSISQKVIRQSTVPTLLLREQKSKLPSKIAQPFRATVALDGSPFAESAILPTVSLLTALSQPGQGELHLLHLVEAPTSEEEYGYLANSDFTMRHEILQEAGKYLQALHTRLLHEIPANALHISWSVEECKDVAEALIQIAEGDKGISTHNASQLLALATHGRSGLHRLIIGSVTERVLYGSRLPLLIVHPAKVAASTDQPASEADTDAAHKMPFSRG